MPQALVLCDIDKTLITVDGAPVPSTVRPVAHTLQQGGTVIGLCSDSSVITMKNWATYFDLGGPLIAERGAILLDSFGAEALFLGPWPEYFTALRDRFQRALLEQLRFKTRIGDPYQIFPQLRAEGAPDTEVVVLNTIRQASISAYARVVRAAGELAINLPLLPVLERLLRECVEADAPDFSYYWDCNPDYGILIMGAEDATKQHGVCRLLERRSFNRVIMIGDSIADFVDDPRVEQWAVANASPEYRARCSMVSASEFTPGVEELLRTLL